MNKILVILCLFLIGCSTKKTSFQYKEHQKFDSISYQSKEIIYPAIQDTVYIKSPCDSMGHLKPFTQSFITSQGKVIIEGKNNEITAKIDLKSVSNKDVNQSKNASEKQIEIQKVEKRIIIQDWRLIVALILSVILNATLIYMMFFRKNNL